MLGLTPSYSRCLPKRKRWKTSIMRQYLSEEDHSDIHFWLSIIVAVILLAATVNTPR